jgi:2-polyprenyl-3-methyl-5-hydroxy-6-metoxy-1,4-benzoquinol methylase
VRIKAAKSYPRLPRFISSIFESPTRPPADSREVAIDESSRSLRHCQPAASETNLASELVDDVPVSASVAAEPENAGPVAASCPLVGAPAKGIFFRSCNFCGGVEFSVFKQINIPFPDRIYGDQELTYPYVGKHLELQYLECTNCGLVGINPLTQFTDINRQSFDGERNIVAWVDHDYSWYEGIKSSSISLIYDQYNLEDYRCTNRILDVGCGPGVSLSWLRNEKGWEAFGIDPDQHSARTAWERYKLRIDNGHVEDISAPDEHFDFIIMDNSLEHTFNPLLTLLKAYRLLRKGGGLFIATPNCNGLSTQFLNANAHWGHWFLYSPKTLYDILKRIGFQVTKIFASQESVDQAIIDQGHDIQPYMESLRISLVGEETVAAQVGKLTFCSDYFHAMAVKPVHSERASICESELLHIAQSSLEQFEDSPTIRVIR